MYIIKDIAGIFVVKYNQEKIYNSPRTYFENITYHKKIIDRYHFPHIYWIFKFYFFQFPISI